MTEKEKAKLEYETSQAYLIVVAKSLPFTSHMLEKKPAMLRQAHKNYNEAKTRYVKIMVVEHEEVSKKLEIFNTTSH